MRLRARRAFHDRHIRGGQTMRPFMLVLGFAIFISAGCASSKGASTAFPIDVTGAWVGNWTRGTAGGPITLRLQQTGTKVVGEAIVSGLPVHSGKLEGALDGNELSLKTSSGTTATYTVTGDRMSGYESAGGSRI